MIGIICEYDPFHKGHLYQIRQAKYMAGKEGLDPSVICVMSPNFVQRSSPAFYDKYTRTRMALSGGANLVLELPAYYATATAEKFAFGGAKLLQESGLVDSISFGMEDPSALPLLDKAAEYLANPSAGYTDLLKKNLEIYPSFAKARLGALETLTGAELPDEPNAILVLEYLHACKQLSFSPALLPVKRSVPHNFGSDPSTARSNAAGPSPSLQNQHPFVSASFIRETARTGGEISDFLPFPVNQHPAFLEDIYPAIRYRLCFHSADTLAGIDEISEGLENRILHSAPISTDYTSLLHLLETKRYPTARLRRILLNIYLDITKEKKKALKFEQGPSYLRVLGVRKDSLSLLSRLKKEAGLPVLINYPDDTASLSQEGRWMLEEELRFGKLYQSLMRRDEEGQHTLPESEYQIPLQII
ncbi:MAG: nucleotidyltransferase family protein [Firmicutes bacterium]|nr:nucleotidyltransferase family protein [Bacillota bacterium]